ncbi:cobalamin B12-binding domain-containing protein [Bacillus sp. B-jedd]|uniref:cobalamin B12-binding domain-containing protein n=1 Tax=Bacillus sp. B-jedd TaxID=1476857 RepID=UPI0005155FA2|nr:cobalamin-dependent protein [Bacillus sp. B-jedd]CEG28824.1 B12 binding domain-containing protein [Bacillus sp. B-jedd]
MTDESIREFTGYLLEGNERLAWAFLDRNRFRSRKEVFEEIITPSMRHVGEMWENNEITVADEHIATGVCDFLISRLYPPAGPADSMQVKKAMFLCVEGEAHYLGLKMAHLLFEEHGWDTLYFGPNLPLEYAAKKAADWKPDVIGLSVSIVYNLPMVKSYINELSKLSNRPAIILGGRMAGKYNSMEDAGEVYIVEDLSSLENWVKTIGTGERWNAYQS